MSYRHFLPVLVTALLIFVCRGATFQPPFPSYRVTQEYADFGKHVAGKYHGGIDMVPESSDWTVRAIGPGKVFAIPMGEIDSTNHEMGNMVIIEHFASPKLYSLYAHLGSITASDGQIVSIGDAIGVMGKTGHPSYGYHLHLELKQWPVIGSKSNDSTPFAYTLTHPNLHGYLDPIPFFENDIVRPVSAIAASPTTQKLFQTPTATSEELGRSVSPEAALTILAQVGYWHLVRIPSNDGPATGWMYGGAMTSTNTCWIVNSSNSNVGINLRSQPATTALQVSKVWDGQCFVIKDEAEGWYQVYTDSSVSGSSAWVSKDYAIKFGVGGGEVDSSFASVKSASVFDGVDNLGIGNGDREINPGERCRLRLRIRNDGPSDLHDVRIEASESDPYVTFLDDTSHAGDIDAGDSEYDDRDLEFTVAANAPNSHRIEFEVEISSEEGEWDGNVRLLVARAPEDSGYAYWFSDFILSDGVYRGAGNEDLEPDSGELISLAYHYKYKFSDRPYRPYVVLESADPYVTIESTESRLSGFQEQDEEVFRESGASFSISPDCPIGREVHLEFRIEKATVGRQVLYRSPISFIVTKKLPWNGFRLLNFSGGPPGNNVGISWSSRLGKEYVVQTSEDLVDWRSRPKIKGRPIEDTLNIEWDPATPPTLYLRVIERDPTP